MTNLHHEHGQTVEHCEECNTNTTHYTESGWNGGDTWERTECEPCRKEQYAINNPSEFGADGRWIDNELVEENQR
jgi:hypothetical protein